MNVDFDINNLDFYEDKLVILQIYAFDKKHGSHIIRQLLKGTVKWWVGCAKAGIADSIRRSYDVEFYKVMLQECGMEQELRELSEYY